MKCIIVGIVVFLAIAAAEEEWKPITDPAANDKIHKDCLKESPLSDEQHKQMHQYEYPDEKEVHEHFLCLGKKAGIFSEEHGFYTDRLVAQFAAMNIATVRMRNVIANCVASVDPNDTPAVRAFRGMKCIFTNKGERLRDVNNA